MSEKIKVAIVGSDSVGKAARRAILRSMGSVVEVIDVEPNELNGLDGVELPPLKTELKAEPELREKPLQKWQRPGKQRMPRKR